ncbi:MAG: GNAT family N-acetyltransferase [Methanocorpusculum sp.]|nr:GNAT family N-acetyltransferase [Methanocorpusculum sp.]
MSSIFEMKNSDWGRVSEIYSEALAEGKSTFNKVCPTFEEWNASHLKKCRFVMEADGEICGWCALSPVSSREAYKGVAEISIYIDKKFHGKGLGTKLLTHLCESSEKEGIWSLYAAVFEVNEASLVLHRKCGFREVGYREKIARDIFGNWQNTIIFEKRSRAV